MNYPALQEQSFKENSNRLDDAPKGNETVFESYEPEGSATISQVLDIKNLLADPITLGKVEAIDTFIEELMEKEGMRQGAMGYRGALQRFLDRMPQGLEMMVRSGKGVEVLDHLIREISTYNKVSTESYLKVMSEKSSIRNAGKLLSKLNGVLKNFSNQPKSRFN